MRNITLIGMPGCGKSTLGRLLAHRLGYEFVDCDVTIESSGQTLQQIIDEKGEEGFLRVEEAILFALGGERKVFSPGGSCVLSQHAMEHLRRTSLVVFIDVPLQVLQKRLAPENIDMRGIIGLRKKPLEELFFYRRPLYLEYAHLVVNLDEKPIQESLDILMNIITRAGIVEYWGIETSKV